MPKYGGGSSDYSLFPAELDPLKLTPNYGDTAGAAFRQAAQYTVGRQGIDRAFLETEQSPLGSNEQQKQFVTIDEANQQYGLELKPTYAKRISVGLAEYFQRQRIQEMVDQSILQEQPADIVTGLGAGFAASLSDPAEFTLNLLLNKGLPLTSMAKAGQLSYATGQFVRPSVAARFMSRYPSKTVFSNPFVFGAVEGGGSAAMLSPLIYLNSEALGRKYTLEDALTDVAVSGAAGSVLAGVPGLLTRGVGKARSVMSTHGAPVDPMKAHTLAEVDLNNGRPVDVARAVDVEARTRDLAKARAEVEQQILNHEPQDLTPDTPTHRPLEPVELTDPEAVRHTTPMEQRLLAVTDPDTFRSELRSHLSDLNLKIAKLGELMALPEAQKLEAWDDIHLLQTEVIDTFGNLNEILPATEARLPVDLKTTHKGLITQKSLQKIGKEIGRLNDLAVKEMDEKTRLTTMQTEHARIASELKKAMAKLKEGEAKGWSTVDKWRDQVATLTPQLEHATRLLQAHGVDVQTPELSLAHYVDQLGDNLPPALREFIDADPAKLQEPLYRVRNGIFNAIASRMDQTQKYLQDLDYTKPVRQFPEDDEILRELNTYMEGGGEVLDPAKIHEEALAVIDQQINEYKALEIFDEKNLKRFDDIKKRFDEQLQKTDAVKKGSLQAQICALGGVTEDE
jgi:hypothetical protein